ncbi:uracil-DNA glycosylase [bacterium]|nr:uracil-DNA glycosylase [bacterium]
MNKTQLLNELKKEVEECRRCSLYKTRTKVVFGIGPADANLMIISEAPGYWEDRRGEPFVGAAGKVLDELLESVDIKREDVYICNLLKCRPPGNRDPKPEEIKACTPYLVRQIEIIAPKIICPLGRYSMRFLMEKFGLKDEIQPISKIHGKVFEVKDLFQSIKIIPFYHPATATYNPNMKEILKKDFQILKQIYGEDFSFWR